MMSPDNLERIVAMRVGQAYPPDMPRGDVMTAEVAKRVLSLEQRVLELETSYERHLDKCHTFPPKA